MKLTLKHFPESEDKRKLGVEPKATRKKQKPLSLAEAGEGVENHFGDS